MDYTFVEVLQRGDPRRILYFLVPVQKASALEDMRRRIGERGILTTNDGEQVRAATLDPESMIRRDALRDVAGDGPLFAVNGSIVRDPENVRTIEISCRCHATLRPRWQGGIKFLAGQLGFYCPHCSAHHRTSGRVYALEEKVDGEWRLLARQTWSPSAR